MALTQYKIDKIISESHDTRTLQIAPLEGEIFSYAPGQFVMLFLKNEDNEFKESRAYSIANSPTTKTHLDITYKKAGYFTSKMHELKEGDIVGIKGPYGKFTYDENFKDVVLLAGGVGITPFKSYLEYVADKKLPNKVTLIFSNQTESDILYRKHLEDLDNGKNIRVVFTLTRQEWNGLCGRIDAKCVKNVCGEDFANKIYYICGTGEFVKAMIELLQKLNIAKESIKVENFGG